MGTDRNPPEPFDISGGALCLDFANTLGDRSRPETEKLHAPDDLLRWCVEVGVLDDETRAGLSREGAASPEPARRSLDRAIQLRETLFRIFSGVARGGGADGADLDELNRSLAAALPHLRVLPDGAAFRWSWFEPPSGLDHLLWPVIRSAAELLTSSEAELVRECASERCTWLFVDRSRTHRRRWCDMKVCGNRAKARRHYERKKQAAGAGAEEQGAP